MAGKKTMQNPGRDDIIPIRFQNMGIPNAVFSCCPCFSWLKKKRHSPNFESDLLSESSAFFPKSVPAVRKADIYGRKNTFMTDFFWQKESA